MTEQIFKAPGFFDREFDLTNEVQRPTGIPAGVIGTAERGPAFVPLTVGSFPDFASKFGSLNPKMPGMYAANLFLKNRFSLTYIRTLGAGANETTAEIEATRTKGTVVNAGFAISSSLVGHVGDARTNSSVQFLTARHTVTSGEVLGNPIFSDNDSFFTTGSVSDVNLVRGVLFSASGSRVMIVDPTETWSNLVDDFATPDSSGKIKIVISSSLGSSFASTDGVAGIKVLSASFDPSSTDYYAKVLNTDPLKFNEEKHLLYLNFAVDNEIATLSTGSKSVCITSGSTNTSLNSGDITLPFRNAFGRFDTRYTTPTTPQFISQPFGQTEYDLFRVETLDDGAYANKKVKISIANIKASADPKNPYGTFALLVRNFDDDDVNPEILEQFNNCNLNPDSDNYVARVIGNIKVFFNFDVENEDDRRLVRSGKYGSRSRYIRVIMSSGVENKTIPPMSLPFGFRGVKTLNTNTALTDATGSASLTRMAASGSANSTDARLLHAIVPPLPFRFKVTRGEIGTTPSFVGSPGATEIADSRYYWGVKVSRNNNNVLNSNINGEINDCVRAYTAFAGIPKLDVVVSGSAADTFNNNKFSLARVALSSQTVSGLTASVDAHMKEASYLRNGQVNSSDYSINDTYLNRVTFATLLQTATPTAFNRFSDYAKFTTVVYGGFDGLNILDKEQVSMTDKATSAETGGGANGSYVSPGFATNQSGTSRKNNSVASIRVAAKLMTNPFVSNVNIVTTPGQREPLVTDFVADAVQTYGMAQYIMDIPYYDSNSVRIFDGDTTKRVSVNRTADVFETRAIDTEFVSPYFPNVVVEDTSNNNRRVTLPGSVAALSAIGYNDKVAYPWFAPAGFNRAALDFVKMTQVKVNQPERERLYAVRINPIIKLPNEGFVIFSQQTLEQAGSALQSLNVQRMIISLKQQISAAGNQIIFEQLTPDLRSRFVDIIKPILATVQVRDGIERFEIIADDRNNTEQDVLANRMRVNIKVVPVRAAEFIAIDFIITPSGISFTS